MPAHDLSYSCTEKLTNCVYLTSEDVLVELVEGRVPATEGEESAKETRNEHR